MDEYQILMMDTLNTLWLYLSIIPEESWKKGIANRKICKKKKKKKRWKNNPPPSSLLGVTVVPENGKYCLSPHYMKNLNHSINQ